MKNLRHIITLAICAACLSAGAQKVRVLTQADNTVAQEVPQRVAPAKATNPSQNSTSIASAQKDIDLPDDFVNSLDFLLQNWAIDKAASSNCTPRPNPPTSDDDYRTRLKKLPHVVEMPFNSSVRSFIEIYTQQRRKQVEYLLGLSSYYFPIFEAELEKENLPLELKYLPIIESSLNPKAVSRAGATGIWQFMINTGKMYGLEVNSMVDERMDPVKASKVAAQFLKELYSIYSDWHLAIAAYNCGPGNVNKAINRAGGKQDFWVIYPYLPAETRAYVPIFIAANYVMNYHKEHYLCPTKVRLPVLTDTISINERIHLEHVSHVLNLPIEELRLLNPQYRRDIIPGDIKPYPLCLPQRYTNLYIKKQDELHAFMAENSKEIRRDEVEPAKLEEKAQTTANHEHRNSRTKTNYHTVKKGQNLGEIANKYGTTVNKIKSANGMRSTKINAGQRLRIPK